MQQTRLFIQGDRAALEFYDADGRVRDELDESSWRLLGPSGIPPLPMLTAFLGDARNPGSTLGIVDQRGASVGLSTSGEGKAFVTVRDAEGHTARMDSAHIEISGKDRKPIWQAPNNAH